jgi:hypothetical protein
MTIDGTGDPVMSNIPDHARDYAEAFQRGRDMAVPRPETSASPAIAPHAIGLGVHVARMEEGERRGVARRAEALSGILRALQGATPDPAERLRMARHLARVTPGLGLRPEDISLHDVTDAGVAGHIANVTGLRHALALAAEPRYVAPLHELDPNPEGGARYIGPAD